MASSPALDEPPVVAGAGPHGPAAARSPVLVRAAFGITLTLLAGLVVVSARAAPPAPEQRVGRGVEFAELIRAEQARADGLAARVVQLQAQLADYERPQAGSEGAVDTSAALEAQIGEFLGPAQMSAVQGPGVVVTLDDSTLSNDDVGDYNDLVVHEQDLQAVVNALWAGGAEAMTVAGERVLATTAIRCVGNVLLLHRRTYSPPYVIEAIGHEASLRQALQRDPSVERFRRAVTEFDLGYEVASADRLRLPAYETGPAFEIAQPAVGGVR